MESRIPDIDAPLRVPGDSASNRWEDLISLHPELESFVSSVGGTPLIQVPDEGGARIFAKCEWHNPCGSVKDRVALAMMAPVLRRHGARPLDDLWILEYSGGNLARAIAVVCEELNLRLRMIVHSGAPSSLLDALKDHGADVEQVLTGYGLLPAILRAVELARSDPRWTFLYQHRNTVNIDIHETTTGVEILDQLPADGRVSHWVASIGTGGTLIGVLRALRRRSATVVPVGVTPAELPYGTDEPPTGSEWYHGANGMGNGIRQPFVRPYDSEIQQATVSYPDALRGMNEFRRLTGIAIGGSAAANWIVAKHLGATLTEDEIVVTVFPDAGTDQEWQRLGW
jgi:cysteine synthase